MNSKVKHINISYLIIFLVLIAVACKPKSKDVIPEPVPEVVEYPITIIQSEIGTNVSENSVLYPITEEFLEEFLRRAQDYQGTRAITKVDFPTEWGVLCIERLPEGRELWLLQSLNREWKYLVITSGYGTQRILDMIPIALNLAIQDNDILETEIWTTTRQSDGAFLVEKNYEWIKSVAEATKQEFEINPESFHRSNATIDKYYINEMSRFDYIKVEDTIDYKAVVFFYNKDNKPEQWDEICPILQSYCEEKGIFFEEVYSNFSSIQIRDYKLNDVVLIDINPYLGASEAGMVMIKNGETPKTISFSSQERMMIEIKRYFKLLNQ